jgi:hypothetical protein
MLPLVQDKGDGALYFKDTVPFTPTLLITGKLSHQQVEKISAGFLFIVCRLLFAGLRCFMFARMIQVIADDGFDTPGKH